MTGPGNATLRDWRLPQTASGSESKPVVFTKEGGQLDVCEPGYHADGNLIRTLWGIRVLAVSKSVGEDAQC